MKQYDSNVSAVMMYLQEHNYSNSVTWSHLKCYQCIGLGAFRIIPSLFWEA